MHQETAKKLIISLGFATLAGSVLANGLYRNGVGAEAMSMGGTDTAWSDTPLSAMGDNPAGLGFLDQAEFDLGGVGDVTEGNFSKGNVSNGSLKSNLNALPEGALGVPLGSWPVTLGLSVIPDSTLLADWHYMDPPGGLNGTTTYGKQEDKSEIITLRSAFGAAVKITSQLSFGANIGLVYNENHLKTPYIFQNLKPSADAPFDGAKTLLDLNTSGYGWNVEAGLIFRATTNLQFGVSYKSETKINTTGDATGDPSAQFGLAPGSLPFHYDAEVKNKLPQEASLGASWKFLPQWRAALQVDWINWGGAFESLPVNLSHGNAPVNGVLGSSFRDNVPLNWSDEFVYRAGVEYEVIENLALRLGYSYGQSPVPNSTLTPMTAAIQEHTITAGVGYQWSRYRIDFAYQYDIPVTREVGTSGLLSGEYSHSSTTVSVHTLALTAGVRF